jgi:hypothetical protein
MSDPCALVCDVLTDPGDLRAQPLDLVLQATGNWRARRDEGVAIGVAVDAAGGV